MDNLPSDAVRHADTGLLSKPVDAETNPLVIPDVPAESRLSLLAAEAIHEMLAWGGPGQLTRRQAEMLLSAWRNRDLLDPSDRAAILAQFPADGYDPPVLFSPGGGWISGASIGGTEPGA